MILMRPEGREDPEVTKTGCSSGTAPRSQKSETCGISTCKCGGSNLSKLAKLVPVALHAEASPALSPVTPER